MAGSGKSKEFEFVEKLTAELSSNTLVFPTSLAATMKIRHALNDVNASIEKIARIVGTEPVLSARILQTGNSVGFSENNQPVYDLRKITMRLGISMVRNVAISVGMKQLTQSGSAAQTPKQIDGLWKRSIRVAALSYVVAGRLTQINPDTAMMAGLLHDIGKFYILNRAHQYGELFNNEAALWEVVDLWHLNIGAAILESWEVPEEISLAVLNHRDFLRVHRGPPDLTDVVSVADILDARFHAGTLEQLDWETIPPPLLALNLDQQKCVALMDDAKKELGLIFHALA